MPVRVTLRTVNVVTSNFHTFVKAAHLHDMISHSTSKPWIHASGNQLLLSKSKVNYGSSWPEYHGKWVVAELIIRSFDQSRCTLSIT